MERHHMFCTNCGNELKEGARFCPRCGTPIASTPSDVPSAAQAPTTPVDTAAQAAVDASAPATTATAPAAADAAPSAEACPAGANACPAVDTAAAQPKSRRGLVVGIVVGIVAIIVAAVIGASFFLEQPTTVVYGQDDPVSVSLITRIRPQGVDGTPLTTYTVTLVEPDATGDETDLSSAATTPYKIRVDGEGGFRMADFGDVPDNGYTLVIVDESDDGDDIPRELPVDYGEDNPDAADEIVVAPPADDAPDEQPSSTYDQQPPSAYELYWDTCREYLDAYGDPSWIRAEDGSYMMTGLCVAQLIDFDGDGTEELALVYNTLDDFVPNTVNGYLDQQIDGFTVEIWAYRDGQVELVYDEAGSLEIANGGTAWFTVCGKDGEVPAMRTDVFNDSTIEWASDMDTETTTYYEYDGSTFDPVLTLDYLIAEGGVQTYIDGKPSSPDDATAAAEAYSTRIVQQVLYSLSMGADSLDGDFDATSAATQATLDSLERAASGEDVEAAAEPSYSIESHEETAPLTSSQGVDAGFTTEVIWRYSEIVVSGGEAPAGVAKINDSLRAMVADARTAAEAWTIESGDIQDQGYTADIVSIADGIVSVRTDTYGFAGGAHGTEFIEGIFYDLETGEELSASEALGIDDAQLRDLAADGIRTFFSHTPSDLLTTDADIEDAIASITQNAESWRYYRCEDGIAFVAIEGELGSTAFGSHEIIIQGEDGVSVGSETDFGTSLA